MTLRDQIGFSLIAITRQRFRTIMQLVAMAIGVLAVVLLTGLGEGGRQYVLTEFSSLGKDTILLLPGRKETSGGMPPLSGEGTRDITLDDATSLLRLRNVERIAPLVVGNTSISAGNRSRESLIIGTNAAFFAVRKLEVRQGKILADIPLNQTQPDCVIGAQLKHELFGPRIAIGQWLKLSQYRCRVIGILADTGTGLGINMSDALIIPVANAMQLFNTEGLFRVMIDVRSVQAIPALISNIEQQMTMLHDGQLDVTVTTPDSLLAAFDNILLVLTFAIAGIGGISLIVAGVLIMNMTVISVSQRSSEIGLLKALGASSHEVKILFITEASMLSVCGAALGLATAEACLWLARQQFPDVPFHTPWWASATAVGVAAGTGLLFAWLPARRAAAQAPVLALQKRGGK